jgi:tryptophan synthase alpha chain
MMSRIRGCFEQLKKENKKALIAYITAGDPHPSVTVDAMHALVKSGVNIIEVGVPFSDPMADGPVIQLACERALKHGVRLVDVLGMVKEFRQKDTSTPVVLMGYLNPIEIFGYEKFAKEAASVGVDGVLMVDLPPEEGVEIHALLKAQQLDTVFLLAPTTTEKRMDIICAQGSGFLYYVSVKGVTGSSKLNTDDVAEKLMIIRKHTQLPVGVGFGIKDPESAAAVAKIADAVVVGSVFVQQMGALAGEPKEKLIATISGIARDMRTAMDNI